MMWLDCWLCFGMDDVRDGLGKGGLEDVVCEDLWAGGLMAGMIGWGRVIWVWFGLWRRWFVRMEF